MDDANPGTDRRFEGFDTTIMSESTYRMTMPARPAPTIPIFNVFGICPLKISRTAREGRSHPPDRPERDFGRRIWRDTNMPGRRSHAAEGIVASVSETENRSEATAFRKGEGALRLVGWHGHSRGRRRGPPREAIRFSRSIRCGRGRGYPRRLPKFRSQNRDNWAMHGVVNQSI